MCKTNLDNEGVKSGRSERTLSEMSGECTEIDWSHPEKEVIKYVKYNTVREYSKSSNTNNVSERKNEKVKRFYNISSCDESTHLMQHQDNMQGRDRGEGEQSGNPEDEM